MTETERSRPSAQVRLGQLATILGTLALIGMLLFGLTTKATDSSIDEELAHGSAPAAPDFDLELLELGAPPPELARALEAPAADGRIQLAELRGTPVVLNFWASWCQPCREEAPLLERGWQRWGPKGLLFLGLNMQDISDDARGFLDEFSIDYPTIRDSGKSVSVEYGLTGIPETYFIDARGRVVAHSIGLLTQRSLVSGARAALSGRVDSIFAGGDFKPPRD